MTGASGVFERLGTGELAVLIRPGQIVAWWSLPARQHRPPAVSAERQLRHDCNARMRAVEARETRGPACHLLAPETQTRRERRLAAQQHVRALKVAVVPPQVERFAQLDSPPG